MTLHLPHWKDYSGEEIAALLDHALAVKAAPANYADALKNKLLVMLFQKTSTRTRVSFAGAMAQLGGQFLDMDWKNTQFILAELKDEIRYLSRNADVIMVRALKYASVAEMAEHSHVPIINGCCDTYHPTQALADMLTLREHIGTLKGKKLVYVGIMNNVSNSLVVTGTKLGMQVTLVTPLPNEPAVDEDLIATARKTGLYEETDDLKAAVRDADAVYTDTWVDMEYFLDERFADKKKEREDLMMPYQINSDLLHGSRAKVMHDMPLHAGYEVSREVVESDRSIIFPQAENRMHAEKAILLKLLGKL